MILLMSLFVMAQGIGKNRSCFFTLSEIGGMTDSSSIVREGTGGDGFAAGGSFGVVWIGLCSLEACKGGFFSCSG